MDEIEKRINDVINELRPYLLNDGGDIEFVKYENGTVYIKMLGACSDCEFVDYTIKDGIEDVLINSIPEIKKVVQI